MYMELNDLWGVLGLIMMLGVVLYLIMIAVFIGWTFWKYFRIAFGKEH